MPYAVNRGIRIYYETEGKGTPVLLGHGYALTHQYWYDYGYVQELSENYRVVLLDLRGRGRSDKPRDTKSYQWQTLVEDLVSVLDDLKIEKAHYFGSGMGGNIGFRIPLYAPGRFHSLIMSCAAYPVYGKEDAEDDLLTSVYRYMDRAVEKTPDRLHEALLAAYEKKLQGIRPSARDTIRANDPEALMAGLWALQEQENPDADEVLTNIALPCLVMVGENDPRFVAAKESAKLIPGARFVSFPDLDLSQTLKRSDLALPIVKKFLAEVERKRTDGKLRNNC